ncbi:MAG TPA: DUF2157 domain-containing protein [Solimonas sp.]|nr:DUF2157 domain-containing protein [Solimonas sp.]
MTKPAAAWLRSELPELERAGIVDAATAARLRAHYRAAADDGGFALGLSGILGALLVGLGVILLIAYNWDSWGRGLRLSIAALPLIAGQLACVVALRRTPPSRTWRESAAVFAALAFAGALALVSQIFQFGGDLDRYLLTCALVGLPLLYALDSSVLAVLVAAAFTGWVGAQPDARREPLLVLLAFASLVPHVVAAWRENPHSWRSSWLLGWLLPLCLIALSLTIPSMRDVAAVWFSAWALLLIQIDREIGGDAALLRRPLRVYGELGWALFALAATFPDFWEPHGFVRVAGGSLWHAHAVAILVLLLALALTARAAWRRQWLLTALAVPTLVIAVAQAIAVKWPPNAMALLFNAYVLAIGIAVIADGIRGQRLREASSGLTLIAVLVLLRFFGGEWSFVVRGIAFVIVGLAFLAANVWLRRKVRA